MSGGLPSLERRPIEPLAASVSSLERKVNDLAQATTRRGNTVTLTGQSATVAAANLITAARNAIYRATVIVQVTTADAVSAATVLATIGWTDRIGATTQATTALAVNATGRQTLHAVMEVQGNTAVTYATTVTGAIGAARYAIEVRLERIG